MKGPVRFLGNHADPGFHAEPGQDLFQDPPVFVVQMQRGFPGDIRLQHHTGADDLLGLNDLRQFLFRLLCLHVNAAALDGVHQSVQFKRTERLPHGNTAHIEGLAEFFFAGEFVPDLKAPADDRVVELVIDLNVQFVAGNRTESLHNGTPSLRI